VPRTDLIWIERTRPSGTGLTWRCAAATPGSRCSARAWTTWSGLAYLKDCGQRAERRAERPVRRRECARPLRTDSKPAGDLLKEMQRSRFTWPRGRRVRRHRRRGDHRGHPGRDRREITDEYDTEEIPRARPWTSTPSGWPPGYRCPTSASCSRRAGTGAGRADVDTVGGLCAAAGRVPLPGAQAEVAGLRLLAEGGKDARGRIRITTVWSARSTSHRPRKTRRYGADDQRSVNRAAERREGSDVAS